MFTAENAAFVSSAVRGGSLDGRHRTDRSLSLGHVRDDSPFCLVCLVCLIFVDSLIFYTKAVSLRHVIKMETPDHVDDPTMELETKQSKQSNQSNQSKQSNESPPGDEAQTLSKMSDLIRNMSSNDDIIEGSPNISLILHKLVKFTEERRATHAESQHYFARLNAFFFWPSIVLTTLTSASSFMK